MKLAFSPCPNDTFIFHAWVNGLVPGAPAVEPVLADIDELNAMALRGEPEVTKLSFAALTRVRDRYALLHAGGALGRGCGPLLVVREEASVNRPEDLATTTIAIPGELTTAALLLRLRLPRAGDFAVMRFDQIMPAVAEGRVAAGAIIHEGRFTYPGYGLRCLQDLGEWWEVETRLPIPLGGIAVRRDLTERVAAAADAAVRRSVAHALAHPDAAAGYIRQHAQEMEAAVCREHIALYVNEFSLDYGSEGRMAIETLLQRAGELGIGTGGVAGARPRSVAPSELFWDD
ncbi:MAG: 1,4-dihydroxy-6-naphthoate synthase [Actinobacteria bacterium]|nr:1,4-dihydroxy-6-naphthoate synthase [Actinomycetota bacterium]